MAEPTEPVAPPTLTPLPQPPSTEDWVNFDTRADGFNLELKAHFQPEMNQLGQSCYTNARVAKYHGVAAKDAAATVSEGIGIVRDALEAIQAGPVASVMGRTGVVKGLVEQSNPAIPTGTSLDTLLTTGFYQINLHSIGGIPLTAGQLMVAHSVDSIMQLGIDWTGANIAIRSRGAAAGQWSPGQRLIGDRSEMSRTKLALSPGSAYRADPAEGAIHVVDVRTNMTITIPAPRQAGDQLVLRMLMYTSSSLSFTSEAAVSTVKAPVGGLPSNLQVNTVATFVLLARDANLWEITYTTSHPF